MGVSDRSTQLPLRALVLVGAAVLGPGAVWAQAPLVIEYDDAGVYEIASGRYVVDVAVVPSVARRNGVEIFTGNGQDGAFATTQAVQSVNLDAALLNDVAAGEAQIQVPAVAGFQVGDLLLIVQVQGFDGISGDQTPILSPGNVGRFELARVQTVAGANITLTAPLSHSYTATGDGRTQVVRVPEYTNATITTGTRLVPAANWAGSEGGIVAIAVSGTLTVDGDIDASSAGFRGGPVNPTASGACSENALDTDGRGARKGEGLDRRAFNDNVRRFGRGNYANGGGGGNPHNAGGGGGGNGGAGGFGGFQWDCGGAGADPNTRGMPGARLASPISTRIFFGGGGGGGQQNNGSATTGARGGGMVFVLANAITGTGRLLANGAAAASTSGNDGAGGGGAGGTIHALTRSPPTGSLLFRAAGGNGGNVVTAAAHGPGGGGGGGRIFISAAQGTALIQAPPGNAGTNTGLGGVHGSFPGLVGNDEEGSYVQLAVGVTGVDCFSRMNERPATFHQGELRYLVSRNGGIDWEYWNGLGWVTGARRDNAMDAATLSANIAGFAPNGTFNLRVYLLGDPAFTPAIDTASFVACTCGDGLLAPGEACDDGNAVAGDGCSTICEVEPGYTCTGEPSVCLANCGDGLIGAGEECDDGAAVSGDGCSNVCTVEPGYACTGQPSVCALTCGNGTLQAGEICDDGNILPGDGCSPGCLIEPGYGCVGAPSVCTLLCGNGSLDGTELCDDGNALPNDGCSAGCLIEPGYACVGEPSVCTLSCGNSLLNAGETCDDGNRIDGDGCASFCLLEPGWTCVGVPAVCTEDCGDGLVVGSEGCDDGNTVTETCAYGQNACLVCDGNCQEVPGVTSFCGDGRRDAASGETCDDGNLNAGDGCSAVCRLEPGWTCAGTPSICTSVCGDNIVVGAETCDDGNTVTEICAYGQASCLVCSATCRSVPGATSFCGDGRRDAANGEACDDGDAASGDGCSSLCRVEPGWTCTGTPSVCTSVCGDGVLAGAETCDDGNTQSGDGCSAACALEAGWTCQGVPAVCTEDCGDGLVVGAEACDDGNQVTEVCAYGLAACVVCDATCQTAAGATSLCGDAVVDVANGETCDDGGTQGGDGCSSACGVEPGWSCVGAPSVCTESCGDGLLAGSEACDDGNAANGDGCSSACTLEPGWICVGQPAVCTEDCGDALVVGSETCDDGSTVTESCDYGLISCLVCDASCQEVPGATRFCGDGVLHGEDGEACDDGNISDGDGCSMLCQTEPGWTCTGLGCTEICGDAMVVGFEACDHGGSITESCTYGETSCQVCNEVCSLVPGATAYCGDGRTDAAEGEVCDDGNVVNGDGCSSACRSEEEPCEGSECPVTPVCGNGAVEAPEACDDGNLSSGDGCNSTCEVEKGFECEDDPSVCEPLDPEPPSPAILDGLPTGAQVAGGGCSCSAERTDEPSGTPYLSLLLLGLLWGRRDRARPLRRGT